MMVVVALNSGIHTTYHIVDFKIICESCANWHGLIKRIDEFFARWTPSNWASVNDTWSFNSGIFRVIAISYHACCSSVGYWLDRFFESKSSLITFVDQMISSCYMIVTIRLQTFYWVVSLKIVFFNNLTEQLLIIRHLLKARV